MANKEEYGKRCQLCFRYRRSRMYHTAVAGKFKRLCQECWGSRSKLTDTTRAPALDDTQPSESQKEEL